MNANTNEALLAEIARLKAQNESLIAAKAKSGTLSCKVGEKGGVSVYGLGRFPITLYREQWARLFAAQAVVEGYIAAHASELKVKGSDAPVPGKPAPEPVKA